MMALDPSIIMQLQQYQAPDPLAAQAKAMSLGNMMQQSRLGNLQYQQAMQAQADDQAVRQAYSGANGDQAEVLKRLQSGGQYKAAMGLQKAMAEQFKERQQAMKYQAETAAKRMEVQKGAATVLGMNPTDENAMRLSQDWVRNGIMDEGAAKDFVSQFSAVPQEGRKQFVMSFVAKPDDFIKMMTPEMKAVNDGQSTRFVDTNAFTNPNQAPIQMQASPGELLTDARGKASNQIAGGQLNVARANSAESQRYHKAQEQIQRDAIGAGKAPSGYRIGKDGLSLEFIPGGPADPSVKGSTEDEKKSAGYAIRMQDALNTIQEVTSKNPDASKPGLVASTLSSKGYDAAANKLTSEPRQRVENAQLDALDAALTLATGAAYTREQLKGLAKSYFPQIGDKDAAIKDKEARLQKIIETARIRAGNQAPKIDQIAPQKKPAAASDNSLSYTPSDLDAALKMYPAK